MTILVVDDNITNLEYLTLLFSSYGHTVVTEHNGKAGLNRLTQDTSIGLILSDILMPVMDGFAFCMACKKNSTLSNIPFVFYTATYTEKGDEDFALNLGADLFLRKPLEPDTLIQALEPFIQSRKAGAEADHTPGPGSLEDTPSNTANQPELDRQQLPNSRTEATADANPATAEASHPLGIEEEETYRLYSERLVKKLEKKMLDLEKSEGLFRTLLDDVLDTSRVGKLVLDSNLQIIWINKTIESIFGVDRSNILGLQQQTFLGQVCKPLFKQFERIFTMMVHCFETKTYTDSLEIDCISGTTRKPITIEYWSQPINSGLYSGGRIEYFFDITDRKRLESRLQQVQKLETVGTLAGGIAHDFNNILTAIMGYAELAKSASGDPEVLKTSLEEIDQASIRAKALIKQILTFSRQGEQMFEPVSVNTIILEVQKLLKSVLPYQVSVIYDQQSSPVVFADSAQLVQVVMNLAINAGYAMKDTGGKLYITLMTIMLSEDDLLSHPELSVGAYAKISVRDTGTGIAPEVLSRIFDPFFTTKPKDEGSGMGLSVVHGIVKALGGDIIVYSEVGRGTEFSVYIPELDQPSSQISASSETDVQKDLSSGLQGVSGDSAELRGSDAHGARQVPYPLAGVVIPDKPVLFVDNDPVALQTYSVWLEQLGFRVVSETSGLRALEMVTEDPDRFSVILTDVNMPDIGGIELVRKILVLNPQLPVLYCSGFSNMHDAYIAELGRGIKVLFKPLLKSELVGALADLLRIL